MKRDYNCKFCSTPDCTREAVTGIVFSLLYIFEPVCDNCISNSVWYTADGKAIVRDIIKE